MPIPAPVNRFRRVLLLMAIGMSLTLGATLALGVWQTQRASSFLMLGQSDARLTTILETFQHAPRPPTNEFLNTVLQQYQATGVLYLAVVDGLGHVVASAGDPAEPQLLGDLMPGRIQKVGNRIRASRPLRAPHPPGRPPPGGPPSMFPPDGPPPRPPDDEMLPFRPDAPPEASMENAQLVIEFEPKFADQFEHGSQLTLGVGLLTLIAFIALSIAMIRVLSHRDELVQRLEREKHLSSLGEMSAVLAHEIRNPLASLKGHAQLLVESLPPASKEQTKATRVVNEAIRLEQLTSDLLTFVRSGAIERREVDPVAVLKESADLVNDPRISLQTTSAPRWRFDPDRMQQVLTNILGNAVQASPDSAPVDASVQVEGKQLLYTVRDHGSGIPKGEEERIFEPFFTRKTRGTGLGLAIARRIVAAHGGTITASNHPDGGAVFQIALPEG